MLGLAQTGTGKTVAFVLPILQRLLVSPRPGPRALILTPTRELATQIQAEIERLAQHTSLSSTALIGGLSIARQMQALREQPDVIVACPGRLLDLLDRRALSLDRIEVLVLDEADHMSAMGFLPDVRRILRVLPRARQNLLFAATMSDELERFAQAVLQDPVRVELTHSKPAETIVQAMFLLDERDKLGALEHVLAREDFHSGIVFLRTKRRAKRLADGLAKRGHPAVALQGNMSQPQRQRALHGFRAKHYEILVATDVAARGLDVPGVSHVVNFDVPSTPDAYTHRIGRTGRSGQVGSAFTFVTPTDQESVRAIERYVGASIERRRLSELEQLGSGARVTTAPPGALPPASAQSARRRSRRGRAAHPGRRSSGRSGPGR